MNIYDQQTREVLRRSLRSDSNCVDVGCHVGQILDWMIEDAPDGRHFGFEPLPDLYASLLDKYRDFANVEIFSVALSHNAEKREFRHVVSNPGYSGFRRRRYDRADEVVECINVATERLDSLLPHEISIDFIKVDVEGAELEVLEGARGCLLRDKPLVVFEHGPGAAGYYGTRPQQVFDLLSDCGLRLFTMETWLTTNPPQAMDRAEFCRQFEERLNYYFLAAP